MTDGIGRILGGNNYGVGGYVPSRKDNEANNDVVAQTPVVNAEETQVDPAKVMAFLESNNIYIAPKVSTRVEVDPATQERVSGYMEQFEMIYGIVAKEFGEESAPLVMDFVMDSLMGMVA